MRRAVFTDADRVMRHDINNARILQRRQPDRRAAIIRENKECSTIRDDTAMQRHAIHCRRHAKLANAVIHIAASIVRGIENIGRGCFGEIGPCQIGRSPEHGRYCRCCCCQRHFGRLSRGHLLRRGKQSLEVRLEPVGLGPHGHPVRKRRGVLRCGKARRPSLMRINAACTGSPPFLKDVDRHFERCIRPVDRQSRRRYFVFPQRAAMWRFRALLVWCALPDQRPAGNKRWPRIL